MSDTTHNVQKEILSNGLVVLTEQMEHVYSVSVGIWLRTGSRREPPALNGISHFIEHMVFKGTARRTAEEIAREVDRVGGMLDAFTSKEMVCFNTRVLDEHLPTVFDILADLVLEPTFAEEDIAREQSVVLEEIRMTQDNPEDLVHELYTQNFWRTHALGRPILGTPETVPALRVKQAPEHAGERQHVVDLVRVVAAPGRDHRSVLAGRVGVHLGVGVGEREHDRVGSHLLDPLGLQDAGGAHPDEHVGAGEHGVQVAADMARVRSTIRRPSPPRTSPCAPSANSSRCISAWAFRRCP